MWGKKLEKIFRSSIIVILIASLGVNYPAFAQPTNLGLDVPDFVISGNNVVFLVDEFSETVDLNGDGDQADTVLHSLVIGGSPINHGLAVDPNDFFIDGNNVVFLVDEDDQNTDFNSDGDIADKVLYTLVFGGSPINHGLAIGGTLPIISGNNVVFLVSEFEQDVTDLNGDGDVNDFVLHTLVIGGSPINHGLAIGDSQLIDGNNVVFLVHEASQTADFNGDGDIADFVLHTLVIGGSPINHGLAVGGTPPILDGNNVVFTVHEPSEAADFNGDGDIADFVLHTLVIGGSPINHGLAVDPVPVISGDNVVFTVDEFEQDATDLNGDGDVNDFVLFTLVFGGSPINHGLDATVLAISGDNVVFAVDEDFQTADLNGDGDINDFVLFTLVFGGSPINHGLAMGGVPIIDGNNVGFLVHEPSEATDFNSDGDIADFVLHTIIIGGSPTNHGLAIGGSQLISGNNVVFAVHEPSQNTDFNGDGDIADTVLYTLIIGGSPTNHGLAVDPNDFFIDGNNVVFRVDEASQNTDFNGDGDINDFVLHILVLTPPSGCAIQTAPNVDTIISSNCTVTTTVIAGGSVTVQSPAVMTVTSTGTLDIDFSSENLTVDSGAGVLIEAGGSIT